MTNEEIVEEYRKQDFSGYRGDLKFEAWLLKILTTKDAECFCKNKGFAELIEGSKARWLRSEIEKLEVDKAEQEQLHDQNENCHPTDCEHRAIDSYIDSIITRYKEELLELEKGI